MLSLQGAMSVPLQCSTNRRELRDRGSVSHRPGVLRQGQAGWFLYVTLNGVMDDLGSSVTLFVDRSASDEQVVALERIYQAFSPLQPFVFLVVERAPISFMHLRESPTYEVEIPGRMHLKVQRQLDAQGRPLMRTAAIDYFSNIIEYAENPFRRGLG